MWPRVHTVQLPYFGLSAFRTGQCGSPDTIWTARTDRHRDRRRDPDRGRDRDRDRDSDQDRNRDRDRGRDRDRDREWERERDGIGTGTGTDVAPKCHTQAWEIQLALRRPLVAGTYADLYFGGRCPAPGTKSIAACVIATIAPMPMFSYFECAVMLRTCNMCARSRG